MLAPFTPFLAEELYHNLTGDNESIHLKDWLPAGEIDNSMLRDMNALRTAVNDGLSNPLPAMRITFLGLLLNLPLNYLFIFGKFGFRTYH